MANHHPTAVVVLAAATLCMAARAEQPAYYNEAQAARGAAVYEQHCMTCHGAQLQGNPAAPLTGSVFQSRWLDGQHTADDLYYIMKSQMPQSAPGSLTKQQYVEVLSFVLKANGFPAGEPELEPRAAALRGLKLPQR